MDSCVKIRPSVDGDLPAIAAIYAHHVEHSTSSFELTAPSLAEIARRRSVILENEFPYLVAESDEGRVLGYAYAGPYRLRPAYRFTVEDSIYVDRAATGQGIGKLLLGQLISECQARGAREMIAVIGGSANLPSIRLHEHFGFTNAGILRGVGFKFDKWLDTLFMQLSLGQPIRDPSLID